MMKLKIFVNYDLDEESRKNGHAIFRRLLNGPFLINFSIAPFMDDNFSIEKEKVYSFHILDHNMISFVEPKSRNCDVLSRPNIFHYKLSSVPSIGCLEKVKMKTFETLDDIVNMMSRDICGRRK